MKVWLIITLRNFWEWKEALQILNEHALSKHRSELWLSARSFNYCTSCWGGYHPGLVKGDCGTPSKIFSHFKQRKLNALEVKVCWRWNHLLPMSYLSPGVKYLFARVLSPFSSQNNLLTFERLQITRPGLFFLRRRERRIFSSCVNLRAPLLWCNRTFPVHLQGFW